MSATEKHRIVLLPNGTVRCVYKDELRPVLDEMGLMTIRRASHVEPNENGEWVADLEPVGGPLLGPFRLRTVALHAEWEWLQENLPHLSAERQKGV